MNCSGKHAGMLATCVVNGWPLDVYLDPEHPLQVALAAAVADLAGEPIAATGVDGCGAPVFGVLADRRWPGRSGGWSTPTPGTPERQVADAMRAHPELVAGTGADDTVLMRGGAGAAGQGRRRGRGGGGRARASGRSRSRSTTARCGPRTPVLLSALRRLGVPAPRHGGAGPGRRRAGRGGARRVVTGLTLAVASVLLARASTRRYRRMHGRTQGPAPGHRWLHP